MVAAATKKNQKGKRGGGRELSHADDENSSNVPRAWSDYQVGAEIRLAVVTHGMCQCAFPHHVLVTSYSCLSFDVLTIDLDHRCRSTGSL